MSSRRGFVRWAVSVVLVSALLLAGVGAALAAEPVGVVLSTVGPVEIQGPSREGWQPVALKQEVFAEDVLKTGVGGRLKLLFKDETLVNLGEESEVSVSEFVIEPEQGLRKATLKLTRGVSRFIVGGTYPDPTSQVEVETPTAVIGVRGTTFYIQIVTLAETLVFASVDAVDVGNVIKSVVGQVQLSPNFATSVKQGLPPDPPRPFSPGELAALVKATHVPPPAGGGFSASGGSGPPGEAVSDLAKSGASRPGLAETLDRETVVSNIPQEVQQNIQENIQQSVQDAITEVTQEQINDAVVASLFGVFSGRYTEELQVTGRHSGDFNLDLTQDGNTITGTLQEFDPGGTAQKETRPVNMVLDGETFTGSVVDGTFNVEIDGTVQGETLSGTFNGVNEDGDPISGTWEATKQQ